MNLSADPQEKTIPYITEEKEKKSDFSSNLM